MRLAAIPLFAACGLFMPGQADASSCVIFDKTENDRIADLGNEVHRAAVVFVGEAVEADSFSAVFKVQEVWKGDVTAS